MSWTLKIDGAARSLVELDASGATLAKFSFAPDEFKLVSAHSGIAENGDRIELFFGETRKFCGKLFQKKSAHTASGEVFEYEFRGPWQGLREIAYTQEWREKVAINDKVFTVSKSKVILGYDSRGEKIGILKQIEDIINWAKQRGMDFNINLDFENFNIPADEMKDLNCEEAVMRCMRWAPDLIAAFDYSGEGAPTLNIAKRNRLENVELGEKFNFKSISHCERDDMKVENVCIIYERDHVVDGEIWTQSEKEIYPPDANVGGSKSVIHTIKLAGARSGIENCKVVTETLEPNDAEWWKYKFPTLRDSKFTKVEVENVKRETTLPRELVSGTVFEWMMKSAEKETMSAEITCYIGNKKISRKIYSYQCVATNASTYNYSRETVSGREEIAPFGLAKAIYDASSQSFVEGSATIIDAQNPELLGKRISVPQKFEGAVVVSTTLNIFTKTLTVNYGPPRHLYASDISRMFKVARNISAPINTDRSSGISANSGGEEGTSSVQNLFADTLSISELEISDPEDFESKITLSLYDIEEEDDEKKLDIKLRKILVSKDGKPAYAYILMSQPFPLDS